MIDPRNEIQIKEEWIAYKERGIPSPYFEIILILGTLIALLCVLNPII